MNYIKITTDEVLQGNGLRVCLWLSGCEHHCKGCQNPETWNPQAGQPFDDVAKEKIFAELEHPWIQGLTLSGGDPLYPANRKWLLKFLLEVRSRYPKKDIWLWTGYTIEDIMAEPKENQFAIDILSLVDVVIDGPYIQEQRDITLEWRGSANQRIIDSQKTIQHWYDPPNHRLLKPKQIYLWKDGQYK